ncbi:conidiation-specific protein (con-13) protein [Apiospora marii]|uniref:Conidiation-specific protein (Con-13) protein n=1 Tax=Apiospora marii TaxID=335849 RepID=A0ABR1R312_9PEZI
MHPYPFAWATAAVPLLVLLAQAAQSVPPTAIDPPYNRVESRQEQDLRGDLPDHQYDPPKTRPWPAGIVPAVCRAYPGTSDAATLDMSRLEARDVYYSDCDAPWTICRYDDSRIGWDEAMMVNSLLYICTQYIDSVPAGVSVGNAANSLVVNQVLGKIPVGMRQYVTHIILAPGSYAKKRVGIGAETLNASTAFLSEMSLGVAVHEFSHILDAVVGSDQPNSAEQRFLSSSSKWIEFYNKDTKVPTDYAATAANDSLVKQHRISLVEDFADAGRWAMSNMVRERTYQTQNHSHSQPLVLSHRGPGRRFFFFRNSSSSSSVTTAPPVMLANHLAVYSADWEACGNQIAGYRTMLEDIIFPPGGRCTGKTPTSDAVVAATGQRVGCNYTRGEMGMGAGRLRLRAVGVPAIVPADWVMGVRFPPYVQISSA